MSHMLYLRKRVKKNSGFICFNKGSKHLVKDERGSRPTASCFHLSLDFGTCDEALTLVLTQSNAPPVVHGGVDVTSSYSFG